MYIVCRLGMKYNQTVQSPTVGGMGNSVGKEAVAARKVTVGLASHTVCYIFVQAGRPQNEREVSTTPKLTQHTHKFTYFFANAVMD